MTAVAILHREEILERVAAGEYLASIARDLGLKGKGQSISDYLAKDPEYQSARETGLEAKLANEEQSLRTASPRDVPRARELLSHARWRAEREAPHRWGRETTVVVVPAQDAGLQGSARSLLARIRERTIEGECSAEDDQSVGTAIEPA